jgi:hypothetical protein
MPCCPAIVTLSHPSARVSDPPFSRGQRQPVDPTTNPGCRFLFALGIWRGDHARHRPAEKELRIADVPPVVRADDERHGA